MAAWQAIVEKGRSYADSCNAHVKRVCRIMCMSLVTKPYECKCMLSNMQRFSSQEEGGRVSSPFWLSRAMGDRICNTPPLISWNSYSDKALPLMALTQSTLRVRKLKMLKRKDFARLDLLYHAWATIQCNQGWHRFTFMFLTCFPNSSCVLAALEV